MSGATTPKKRRPGRPSNASSGRTSVYVHAPIAKVKVWEKAAKDAGRTLNGWLVELADAAVDRKE